MGTVGRVRLGERSLTVTDPTDICMRYCDFEDVFIVGSGCSHVSLAAAV